MRKKTPCMNSPQTAVSGCPLTKMGESMNLPCVVEFESWIKLTETSWHKHWQRVDWPHMNTWMNLPQRAVAGCRLTTSPCVVEFKSWIKLTETSWHKHSQSVDWPHIWILKCIYLKELWQGVHRPHHHVWLSWQDLACPCILLVPLTKSTHFNLLSVIK